MDGLEKLPAPVSAVTIPAVFSPTSLIKADECRLQAVWNTISQGVPSLGSHPTAELGRVLHRLYDKAAKGLIPDGPSPEAALKQTLEQLLAEAKDRLSKDRSTESYSDLIQTLSPLAWRRKVRIALDTGLRLLAHGRRPKVADRPTSNVVIDHLAPHASGIWSEAVVSVPSLRLKGRVDLLEKTVDRIVIRDLKTGRTLDKDGHVLIQIQKQLRLYGTMVAELASYADIYLIVEGAHQSIVDFDSDILTETRLWLQETLNDLPAGLEVNASSLATPGAACLYCPHRHVCATYLSYAPVKWRTPSQLRLPNDVWGVVLGRTDRADGTTDITLKDEAGRLVKVFALKVRGLKGTSQGDRLWFFGLRSNAKNDSQALWHHPVNFRAGSDNGPEDKAWSLRVFNEPASETGGL